MVADANELMELLDLEEVERGVFMGPPTHDERSRVFGGQTLAQALAAACFTVDGRTCHSLHGYFLRPGIPGRPTRYEVVAFNDGQRMSTRQVVGLQRDEPIFMLGASFQGQDGTIDEYQVAAPQVPKPQDCLDTLGLIEEQSETLPQELREAATKQAGSWPVEMRPVDPYPWNDPQPRDGPRAMWLRVRGELPDPPNVQRCALTYASDLVAMDTCLMAIGRSFLDPGLQIASLDHAMWFHRPFRADTHLLFVQQSVSVGNGRGLSRGDVFDTDGQLVASLSQEALILERP